MTEKLFIVPTKPDSPGMIDLLLLKDESIRYDTGATADVLLSEWIEQPTKASPDGFVKVHATKPIYDKSEKPVITGYSIHANRPATVAVMGGGYATKSRIPRTDYFSSVVVLVDSTDQMLQILDTRLQAVSSIYGIVPGHGSKNDGKTRREAIRTELQAWYDDALQDPERDAEALDIGAVVAAIESSKTDAEAGDKLVRWHTVH